MATTAERIAQQYPFLAALINAPGMRSLLTKAVDVNQPYSAERFRAELMKTGWWRQQSESQRAWGITVSTSPAEANQQRSGYAAQLNQAANRYGVQLNTAQLRWLTEVGLQRGWQPNDPVMLSQFSRLVHTGRAKASGGERRTAARSAQQMARRDYMVPMTNKNAAIWGDRVARGHATMDDVRTALADKALKAYPQFSTGLKQGQTMYDLTDGYRATIAEELEIDPERIDLSEGRWSKVLGVRDGATKKLRPMTNFEALQLARQDPRFWRTGKGKQMDASATNTVLSIFGQRASLGGGAVKAF